MQLVFRVRELRRVLQVQRMIISTTLTGGARADVIGHSLATIAPEVDLCLVIDTGTTDNAIDVARAAVPAEKFRLVSWPWRNDFAAARNFALDAARAELKTRRELLRQAPEPSVGDPNDWILTADTDEWPRYPGARAWLASVSADRDAVLVKHASGTYNQVRAFRATTAARWAMPVHEYCAGYRPIAAPESWCFECQPRPTEDKPAKYAHYRTVLEKWTSEHPDDPRGWYYLADTLTILGYRGSAIKAFVKVANLPGWAPQAGWACYRGAICLYELGFRDEAIALCQRGLQRCPGEMAELAWLAGWIAYQMADYQLAEHFALGALAIGPKPDRPGFSYPKAQQELPAQLLEWARFQLAGRTASAPPAAMPM
jgi:tetratricopeptide (TPR) repeat protein